MENIRGEHSLSSSMPAKDGQRWEIESNTSAATFPLDVTFRFLFVGGGWNFLSVVINRLVPNLLVIVMAFFLQPAEIGVYSYIIASYTVLSLFSDLGIAFALQKFIPENPPETAKISSTALALRFFNSLMMALLCLGVDRLWKVLNGHGFLIGLLLVSSTLQTVHFVWNAKLKYKQSSLFVMVRSLFWLALAVALLFSRQGATGPIWALAISYVIFGLLMISLDRSLFGLVFDRGFARRIIRFGILMTAASSFNVVALQAGILGLAYLATATQVGVYKLASTFGMIPMLLGEGIIMPLLPLVKRSLTETPKEAPEFLRLFLRILIVAGLFVPGVLIPLGKPLINLVFGAAYLEAVSPLKILAGASFIGLLFNVLLSISYMSHDLKIAARTTSIVAVLSIGGSLTLIPQLGANGAAWALVIAFSTGLVIMLRWLGPRLRVRLEWQRYSLYVLSAAEMTTILFLFTALVRRQILNLVGGMFIAPLLYISALFVQKAITRGEVVRLIQIARARA